MAQDVNDNKNNNNSNASASSFALSIEERSIEEKVGHSETNETDNVTNRCISTCTSSVQGKGQQTNDVAEESNLKGERENSGWSSDNMVV